MGHNDSLLWMVDEARNLHAQGRTRGKSWTLAQVCEHLALAIQGTVVSPAPTGLPPVPPEWWRQLPGPERLKRRAMKRGLFLTGRLPAGVPAPAEVRPSASPDFERAIRALADAAAAFDEQVGRTDRAWIFHPILGPMSGPDWHRFHQIHARHHFRPFQRKA